MEYIDNQRGVKVWGVFCLLFYKDLILGSGKFLIPKDFIMAD